MTAPEPVHLRPEVRALIVKAFIGEAEKELAELTKQVAAAFPLPATVPFESPLDGAPLGRISRARTTPEWRVTAMPQVVEHFTREYPNVLETVYLLDVPGRDEPVALPEDHPITQALLGAAPDLLTPERRVPPQVIADAVQECRDKGQAVVPGIQLVRKGQGALSVVYDKKEGPQAIRRMVAAGIVDWTGRPVLSAADEQAEAS